MPPAVSDSLITLDEAARRVRLPDGRPLHAAMLRRWAAHGLGGVRLETVEVGGEPFTTPAAVARFLVATTPQQRWRMV